MNLIKDLSMMQCTHSDCILVVINTYIKMAHFIPTVMKTKTLNIANLLHQHVIKHHSILKVIISDRDKQ